MCTTIEEAHYCRQVRQLSTDKADEEEFDNETGDKDLAEDLVDGSNQRDRQRIADSGGTLEETSETVNEYAAKCRVDKGKLLDFLLTAADVTLDHVKVRESESGRHVREVQRCHFLSASMQSFDDLDGTCIPAEIRLNEFKLKHGIIDQVQNPLCPTQDTRFSILRHRGSLGDRE
jgi:hypothetical protein